MDPWLILDPALFGGFAAVWGRAGLFAAAAVRHKTRPLLAESGAAPRVSVIVPAHNEAAVIAGTLRALAASEPPVEIILVDDGSSDGTSAVAQGSGVPVVVLALSPNRGKAAALNAGIQAASGDIIVTVDADTHVAPDAVRRLAAPFADPRVGAVAGNVKVGNQGSWLTLAQSLEYIGALNIDRRAQAIFGCITTVPGAAGAYRRAAVLEAGGLSGDTLAEDTDLTLALLSAGWEIRYADGAIARTEAPEGWRALYRQRLRWQHGNLQCAWKHRRGLLSGPPALRLIGLPNLWFSYLLVHLLAPLSVVWAARAGLWIGGSGVLAVFVVLYLLDLVLVAAAFRMDRERTRDLWIAPVQRLVWPFFLWFVFLATIFRILTGRAAWTRAPRTGALGSG